MALYQKINDPTRTRDLQCGDKYAREAGWIPYQEPAKAPDISGNIEDSQTNKTEPENKSQVKPKGRPAKPKAI